jgi:hypothetical protein
VRSVPHRLRQAFLRQYAAEKTLSFTDFIDIAPETFLCQHRLRLSQVSIRVHAYVSTNSILTILVDSRFVCGFFVYGSTGPFATNPD